MLDLYQTFSSNILHYKKILNRLATPSCSWLIECWMKTVDRLAGTSQWLKITLKANSELSANLCASILLCFITWFADQSEVQSDSFSSPEPVVSWLRGRLQIKPRVALGTRMNLTRSHYSHMRFSAHFFGFMHFFSCFDFLYCVD